jgi:hypothetical protein
LSDPDVIRQLWNDFAEVGGLETHVLEVDDLDAEQVVSALTRRWQAGTLHI